MTAASGGSNANESNFSRASAQVLEHLSARSGLSSWAVCRHDAQGSRTLAAVDPAGQLHAHQPIPPTLGDDAGGTGTSTITPTFAVGTGAFTATAGALSAWLTGGPPIPADIIQPSQSGTGERSGEGRRALAPAHRQPASAGTAQTTPQSPNT